MADIWMCRGENCNKKEDCYRYKAVPNPYWQSYFFETPLKCVDGEQECEFYIELEAKI